MAGPSRRRVLESGAVALPLALAGCGDIPFLGASMPALKSARLSVRDDGDAAFAFTFGSDVQSAIDRAPISKEDVVSVAADEDLDLSFEPVEVEGVDAPPERLVRGRIRGFAKTKSWPVGTWYSTPRVVYEEKLPEEGSAPLTVRFPDDGQFTFPAAHTMASSYHDGGDSGLFDYAGSDPSRTFPFVQYYAHSDITAMRAVAEYRYEIVRRVHRLYDIDWYRRRAMEDVRAGLSELVAELGRAGVESIVTGPLPDAATAPLDVKSIGETLRADLPKLESSLDTLERGLYASVNESWMADLRGARDGKRGIGHLGQLANKERVYVNPKLATSNDPDGFVSAFTSYRSSLEDQRSITGRLRSPDSVFRTVQPFGGAYWQNLHDLAQDLIMEFDQQLGAAADALAELRSVVE